MSIADKIARLQTAKTNIATAITAKGGTVASGDGFEDFANDIGTIQTGITPSGTKNITSNGTYDVTEFANANVNVQPTNYKTWKYVSTGTLPAMVSTVLVSGDPWIAQHYNDPHLSIVIKPEFICRPGAGIRSIISVNGSNSPIAVDGDGASIYSIATRFTSDIGYVGLYARQFPLNRPNDLTDIGVNANGDITLVTYGSASYMLQAGTWDIIAFTY